MRGGHGPGSTGGQDSRNRRSDARCACGLASCLCLCSPASQRAPWHRSLGQALPTPPVHRRAPAGAVQDARQDPCPRKAGVPRLRAEARRGGPGEALPAGQAVPGSCPAANPPGSIGALPQLPRSLPPRAAASHPLRLRGCPSPSLSQPWPRTATQPPPPPSPRPLDYHPGQEWLRQPVRRPQVGQPQPHEDHPCRQGRAWRRHR